ncbi:hypothetical protein ACFVYJ_01605 [Pontibacter sp. JAM-7]|uniref:hypothetical protein n=1 Tax=Pontibacter sp. JAM-7 TaxID=3366581 RepID=UPI003AF7A670
MSQSLGRNALGTIPVGGYGVSGYTSEVYTLTSIAIEQSVEEVVTLSSVAIEQNVGQPVPLSIAIEQSVELREVFTLTSIGIEQNVQAVYTLTTIGIEQSVTQSIGPAKPWDLLLRVGTQVIPADQMIRTITITRGEGDAALMDASLRPPRGTQNLIQYQGKPVTLDVIENGTTITRVYTGVVDIPEIDLIPGHIMLRCTDRRTEQNNGLERSFVDGIGYHSLAVFNEPDDQHEEIQQRLETVEASLDYDAYGKPHLTSWTPKATPDFTLGDSDIYRRQPKVVIANRGRIINRVDITFERQYKRLRHRERNFSFDSDLTACEYGAWGLPPRTQMLRSAIESAGWPHTNLSITGLDDSGIYNCYGSRIVWSTKQFNAELQPKKDENDQQVYDADNNPVYEQVSRSTTDVKSAFASAATWTAATRFVQNISEQITVSIQSPDSIAQYGEVKRQNSHGIRSDYDQEAFEDFDSYAAPMSGMVQSANGDWVMDADGMDGADEDWRDMTWCAIRKGMTTVRGSHRANRVNLQIPILPQVDLRHTIETTAGRIQCKGKVARVQHTFDCGASREAVTEIEIALSRVDGTFSGDGAVLVYRPAVTDPNDTPSTIQFGTHTIPIGGTQDENWNGYIFQKLQDRAPIDFKTPVALIIDTPDIDDNSRENRDVTASQTEQIGIRNDLLTVVFE